MDTNLSNNLLESAHMDEKRAFPRDAVTPSQKRALAALLEARSIAAAARKARVGDSTLRRWLREDEAVFSEPGCSADVGG